jgi:hypothetical protein
MVDFKYTTEQPLTVDVAPIAISVVLLLLQHTNAVTYW